MVEIITLGLIVAFCMIARIDKILYLLLLLLPFHSFIKNVFSRLYDGGNLFSSWKEIAVLILLYKIFMEYPIRLNKDVVRFIFLFFFVIILYFLMAPSQSDALATFRDHTFPVLLFVALANFPFRSLVARNVINILCISTLLVAIGGFLQNFVFKVPVATIMNRIDFIDAAGYIQYNSSSARIMGFERMSGLIGGPNDFGLTIAFLICALGGIVLTAMRRQLSRFQVRLTHTLLLLALVCLILSFSRAGWGICGIAFIFMWKLNKIRLPVKLLLGSALVTVFVVLILAQVFPYVGDVITDTFTGKEASAADRGNSFSTGLNKNISEPLGHGLGSTDQSRTGKAKFYSESAFMNITYEIGVPGLICLILLHLKIMFEILRVKKRFNNPFSSIAIAVSAATLVACIVSVNPYGMPYLFYWWTILGLGINRSPIMPRPATEKEPRALEPEKPAMI